jgi:hypothetical protein
MLLFHKRFCILCKKARKRSVLQDAIAEARDVCHQTVLANEPLWRLADISDSRITPDS